MAEDFDWLTLLRLGGSLAGGLGGLGGLGGVSGVGLPDAGSTAAAAATAAAPVSAPVPAMPPELTLPAATSLPPPPVTPTAIAQPPAALPTPPPTITPAALPSPDPVKPIWPEDNPVGTENTRSWWQRNVSDPTDKAWDKAWTEDPKTGMTPAMKALQGAGGMVGKLGPAPASSAPPVGGGGGGGGGGGYRPGGAINASQMALAREQARQLLMQRATLNAPWLKQRLTQSGLMG